MNISNNHRKRKKRKKTHSKKQKLSRAKNNTCHSEFESCKNFKMDSSSNIFEPVTHWKDDERSDEGGMNQEDEMANYQDSFQVISDDTDTEFKHEADLFSESNTMSTIASSDLAPGQNGGEGVHPIVKESWTTEKRPKEDAQPKSRTKRKKSVLDSYPVNSSVSESSSRIILKLKHLYKEKVMPIEHKYGLYNFCLPTNEEIQDSEFDAKPMVLLLGQYSTG